MEKTSWKPERMDLQIGLTIVLCLFLCHWANGVGLQIESLAVTTGALMCVQDSTKAAYATSLIRMVGVLCGGLLGMVIAVIDNLVGQPYCFYLLCGMGVVANLLLCKRFHMIYVQARVSTLTLLLVVMVFQGTDRLSYALNRFTGSLAGAFIALAVTFLFGKLAPGEQTS